MICMAALLMVAVSCKKDKKNEIENPGSGFRASVEQQSGDSKTHLEGLSVKWDDKDAILVTSSTCTTPKRFVTNNPQNEGYDLFTLDEETLPEDFYTPSYTAYYPAASFSGSQLTLPTTQTYVKNTFANGANPMAAASGNDKLDFKNVCGVLKLQLYSATACQVQSISITSNNNEQLCGTGTVTLTDGVPALGTLSNGGSTLTLLMGEGGKAMSTSESAPTAYYFVVPVGTLGTSFTVKVTETGGKVWSKTANAPANLIARSQITVMPKLAVTTNTPVIPTVTTIVGCVNCTYTFSGKVTVSGTHNCEYGFVYAKTADNADPTIGGTGCVKFTVNTENLSGSKDFTADLSTMNLEQDVEYTVKAYGICDAEAYGTKQTYVYSLPKPLPSSWTNGKSPKKFTVASGKQVYFSQGNLQYVKSTNTWQFAEHQCDIVETLNQNVGENYATQNIVTLFGWGTSGYNNKYPYMTSTTSSDYGNGNSNISGTNYDWGVNCAISNGGNQAGKWRTLTGRSSGEWYYLINKRTNAANLYGLGKVGSCTPGLIILPDDWKWEGDVAGFAASWKSGSSDWSNKYSYSDWAKMEAAGAVFLPAAGYRDGTLVDCLGSDSRYWSSTYYDSSGAYFLFFGYGYVDPDISSIRNYGFCVRLVSEN